ncbi:Serine aminopeptidase [Phytophthora infestans]|uniref:Serine aminopeptidase n=1 Tax=Phytophthora infestans TaxID=4787 RepID=A0A833WIR7_PHYIN|nr:Serine aminopeptidase [Phytophthora infestans]KAF4128360.1 Serine aminopeptidase [Phytophthora infestans]
MGNSESRETSSSGSNTSRPVRRSLPPQSSIDSSDMAEPEIRAERRSASMPNEREVVATNRRHVPRPRPSRRLQNSISSSNSDDQMQRERGGIERGQEATEEASSQLSYWYLIKNGYTELVHLIIRPPRTDYDLEDLGPEEFSFVGRSFIREDFTVVNDRRQKLVCSHWRPATSSTAQLMPCVVYLHGNSSCRLEALGVLRTCLAAGLSVAAFDTAGCGKSDGEYISLGYYERDDLRDVVTYLRAKMNIGAVALWGRSMGAATALLHADRDPSIAGIVVDSAFASLEQLVEEVVERGRQEGLTLPGFLVKIVLKFIRSSVKKRAHFNLRRLAPIDHAPVSFVPALFVAAEHDSFIAPHHSDQIFAAYGGDKNLVKVDGDHNSSRPQFLLDSAAIFLQTALQVDAATTAQLSSFADGITGGGGRVPWEGAVGRTSSLSMCSSPASSYRMTMDLDARYSGKKSMMAPMESWSCPSCTFVNRPLSMQCEMCRNIYFPDDNEDMDDAGDEEDDALSSNVARSRALTTGGVRLPSAHTQRRQTLPVDAVPPPSTSLISSTSAQRPTHSERSVAVAMVTTAATSVSSRMSSP